MGVRDARRSDLLGVARVVHAACWETYTGLLKPETISEAIAGSYSPSALKRRMLAGELTVAVDDDEVVLGFVMRVLHPDHLGVFGVAVDPEYRRSGIARRLVESTYATAPDLPVSMTVLLGSLDGEEFAESMGFVPGEINEHEFFGEPIIERTWWRSAT